MLESIGAPSWVQNERQLNAFYQDTGFISSENFFSSSKAMSKWYTKLRLRYLRYDDEKTNSFAFSPAVVNAFYMRLRNNFGI
ncbi:hypothetical protein B4U80_14658 [Leptotrombidium deliense]|uniref:Uncharacterized protein n=1 Tax=Leptotrombidium deliense TaxID=299467 RepID=A0A443RSN8_9ACAR|nr:hypothetical protein B4U80_14658 [Leptotrombidium deliense]